MMQHRMLFVAAGHIVQFQLHGSSQEKTDRLPQEAIWSSLFCSSAARGLLMQTAAFVSFSKTKGIWFPTHPIAPPIPAARTGAPWNGFL
jgi:hypothetical protein